MQTQIFPELNKGGGGRIASPKLRELNEKCEDFSGLEEGVNRYDLLLLVKRTGKAAGFTSKMIQLLDYYMAFTRDIDWEEGSRPIVYKAQENVARDMGVSEKQIQNLEKQLFEVGALTWHDSGNHRRYGQRCEQTGQILYAFGVDLTPLAYLRSALQAKLHDKQLYDNAWKETKRQISYYRRQIRSILLEAESRVGDPEQAIILTEADIFDFSRRYAAISMAVRSNLALERVRSLLEQHKELYRNIENKTLENDKQSSSSVGEPQITHKTSSSDEENFAHYKYTNQKQIFKKITCSNSISFQKSVVDSSQDNLDLREGGKIDSRKEEEMADLSEGQDVVSTTGLQHVSLKQLLNISSERFKELLPIEPRPMNHGDFIDAAAKIKSKLGISQGSWGHACLTLGRIGATVCVILTDQANLREENRVMKPGAYFNAMINRAKTGDLKLHQSVMGILKREFANDSPDEKENVSE